MVLKLLVKTVKSVRGALESDPGVWGPEPPSILATFPKFNQLFFGTDRTGFFGPDMFWNGTNRLFWNGARFRTERTGPERYIPEIGMCIQSTIDKFI